MSLERGEGDWTGSPEITLGGQKFVIPPLVLRQTIPMADINRQVREEMKTVEASAEIVPPAEGSDKAPEKRIMFTTKLMELYVEVIRIGLLRAYPKVTRDDVLDLASDYVELALAVTTIVRQSGGKEPVEGEQTAASG